MWNWKNVLVCGLLFLPKWVCADTSTAIGLWNTVDDKTGQVLSQVEFYTVADHSLSGKIVNIFPVLGQNPKDLCGYCKGDLQNKPILGMTIVTGMLPTSGDTGAWSSGQVLDPKSGSVYHGKMWLSDNGCQLHLRGYIGISLFGRTEVWTRANEPTCK